jgi:hypothetical protein
MLLEQQIRTAALELPHKFPLKLPRKALTGLLALSMQDYYASIVSINISARMLAEIHDLDLCDMHLRLYVPLQSLLPSFHWKAVSIQEA